MKRKIFFLLLTFPFLLFSCNDLTQSPNTENIMISSDDFSDEKTETSREQAETSQDETASSGEQTETSADKTESSSEQSDTSREQTETSADKTESSSEKTASSSSNSDASAEKSDTEQKTDSSTEKTETSSSETDTNETDKSSESENPQNQNIEKLPDGNFRIFAPGVSQNKFYDANKTGGDNYLCWAASSSNLIAWYQDLYAVGEKTLDSALPRSEQEIFSKFKSIWSNQEGSFLNGILWYIPGTVSHSSQCGFLLNYLNAAKWNPLRPTAYKQIENISLLEDFSKELILALENGAVACGITDRNFRKGVSGHAITIWGAEFSQDSQNNDAKLVSSIWISDSDDNKTALAKCSLSQARDESAAIDFVKIDYKVYPPFDKIKNIMILYAP